MKKLKKINKFTLTNIKAYGIVLIAFAILFPMQSAGMINHSISGQLVPICTYIVPASSTHWQQSLCSVSILMIS